MRINSRGIHIPVFVLLTACLIAPALPAFAAAAEDDYIAVTGHGKARQWPDYTVVKISMWVLEKTPDEAITKLTDKVRALAGELKKTGIPEDRIDFLPPTVQLSMENVTREDGEPGVIIHGFNGTQEMRITIDELDRVGTVIMALTKKGAQLRSSDVEYMVEKPDELKARAQALAIADARKKAKAYAEGVGRKLGKALIVEEALVAESRLYMSLREEITGEYVPPRTRYSGGLHSPAPAPLTPQPVSSSVTIYAKFALQ